MSKIFILIIISILLGSSFLPISTAQNVKNSKNPIMDNINGQIIFSPLDSDNTYLLDATGTINHVWPSSYHPGTASSDQIHAPMSAASLPPGSLMNPQTDSKLPQYVPALDCMSPSWSVDR